MRGIWLAMILTAALSGLGCGVAAAQSPTQLWQRCRDDDSDHLIRACTTIIRSGRETPDGLSRAFFNRGRAWSDKGDFARAIADFDQAIRLDPAYADAFNNRGVAYAGKGDPAHAVADFDRAVQIDPHYAIAIFNRGLAYRAMGREAEAARDFAAAKQVGPRLTPPKE